MRGITYVRLYFRDDYDEDAIAEVIESFGTDAELDAELRSAKFAGNPERAQEFIRACENIEPLVSVRMRTINL